MKNQLLALLIASAFSTGASAAMVSIDAGNYTFSYDDSFWGVETFSRSGDIFSFSNLAARLGANAMTSSDLAGAHKSFSYRTTSPSPSIFITADSGYYIDFLTSTAIGSVTAGAGSHPSNTSGSSAKAQVNAETHWFNDEISETVLNDRRYRESRSAGGGLSTTGSYGYFETSEGIGFGPNVTSLSGLYSVYGSVEAAGKGSWANAYQDIARFEVSVLPVPEPETWAMFMAGLGIIGAVARRRRHMV